MGNVFKGFRVSGHKEPAIVKADRDPAIVATLDNLTYLTLQRRLGFPCETFSDQSDSIANFETVIQLGLMLPLHSRTIAAQHHAATKLGC
jgi:hypothetical protein